MARKHVQAKTPLRDLQSQIQVQYERKEELCQSFQEMHDRASCLCTSFESFRTQIVTERKLELAAKVHELKVILAHAPCNKSALQVFSARCGPRRKSGRMRKL